MNWLQAGAWVMNQDAWLVVWNLDSNLMLEKEKENAPLELAMEILEDQMWNHVMSNEIVAVLRH